MEMNTKKVFSRIGISYLLLGIISIISQIILVNIVHITYPDFLNNFDCLTILGAICTYVIPIPFFILLMKKITTTKIEKRNLTLPTFLICICITFVLMYVGNIIGLGITDLLSGFKNSDVINPVSELINSSNIWMNLILISIIGPIFEEIFFRKMLIDRTIKYGGKISIFLSALLFGLFHGNLNQFFYAFLMGGFFAYLYIKTGKIIYPIVLHIIINLSGSVISLFVGSSIDILSIIYSLSMMVIVIVGLYYIIKDFKKFKKGLENNIKHPVRTSLLNIGMLCFIGYYILEIVYTILI